MKRYESHPQEDSSQVSNIWHTVIEWVNIPLKKREEKSETEDAVQPPKRWIMKFGVKGGEDNVLVQKNKLLFSVVGHHFLLQTSFTEDLLYASDLLGLNH